MRRRERARYVPGSGEWLATAAGRAAARGQERAIVDVYETQIEHGAERFGVFVEGQAQAQWPGARVVAGRTPYGNRYWEIDAPVGRLRVAVTEPALLGAVADQLLLKLERLDWLRILLDVEPDGLLVTADGTLFVWDAVKDRGTRPIDTD